MLLSLLVSFFIGNAYADYDQICIQNFNAYGPAYASKVKSRTQVFSVELQKDSCDLIHLQEAWTARQINTINDILKWDYKISSPNLTGLNGLMSLYKGQGSNFETYSFKINNLDGLLDGVREKFNVEKAFHVFLWRPHGMPEEIYAVNTHLHPTSQAVRLTQILDILSWRQDHLDKKVILSGDFNASPDSLEIQVLRLLLGFDDVMREHLGGDYPEGFCTYCRENKLSWNFQDKIFDYVFLSNYGRSSKSQFMIENAAINMQGTAQQRLSDHYGVRVRLKWKTGEYNRATSSEQIYKLLGQVSEVLRRESHPAFKYYIELVQNLIQQPAEIK